MNDDQLHALAKALFEINEPPGESWDDRLNPRQREAYTGMAQALAPTVAALVEQAAGMEVDVREQVAQDLEAKADYASYFLDESVTDAYLDAAKIARGGLRAVELSPLCQCVAHSVHLFADVDGWHCEKCNGRVPRDATNKPRVS